MSIKKFRGKAGHVFWPTCDRCGTQLGPEVCWMDARNAMASAKWLFVHDAEFGWSHYCPVCAASEEDEE